VSYGGSSLIVNAAAAGIILNVSRFGVSTPREAQAAEKRTPLKSRLRTAGGGAG
jgi:hypothetical protein